MEKFADDKVKVIRNGKEVIKRVSELLATEIMTVGEFKKEYGHQGASAAGINYAMDDTDRLDGTRKGGTRFIVKNSKCKEFKFTGAGRKRMSTMKF